MKNSINNKILLKNWKLQSSASINQNGKELSSGNSFTKDWYETIVPSTVLGSLVSEGVFENPYRGTNLKDIPREMFEIPWWYHTEFELSENEAEKNILISFDGINYKANIWLNGKQIAETKDITGAFRRYKIEISNEAVSGSNILAVEVFPPEPGDYSIGFVDWNPSPPDNNLGIFREVTIHIINGVSIENPFIQSKLDLETLQEASLTITTDLVNHAEKKITGILSGEIENIKFGKSVSLEPSQKITVNFSPDEFSDLLINNPKLWWPVNLGEPNLYRLDLSFAIDDLEVDTINVTFGIREVEDYTNDDGHRGFRINGRKVLIKGAGWTDDLFLQDTHESEKAQIDYVKHMNLNCIRLEGFWGKDHNLYDLCDEHGILMMVGWSCHWEHEQYLGKPVHTKFGGVVEPNDIDLIAQSWEDQVLWLRNHPSIFVWAVASDFLPHPDLERKYVETFSRYDTTRPYLNSTGGVGSDQTIITSAEIVSAISGSSGVKMLGPYAYTPPVYWFTDKNLGGAYGFNTETCPGANVPPIESIKKMIPEKNLWPIDEVWDFHCGKNDFATIDRFREAIIKRYGPADNVEEFCTKSQMLNYELMRPMFEAFQVNKGKATGIIQWMLNSAWPEMYWQLYDSYLMPNGAFYATKKACEPLHLLYNYGDNSIYLINDFSNTVSELTARISIFDINSSEVFSEKIKVDAEGDSSAKILQLPEFKNLSETYFLNLRLLYDNGEEAANNFYWLSTKNDVLDYDAEFDDWAFYTPSREYADYTLLNTLSQVNVNVEKTVEVNGDDYKMTVIIENPNNNIAFFLDLNIFDTLNNDVVLPVLWDDNFISLLPYEKKIINAEFKIKNSQNSLVLRVKGWNLLKDISLNL